MDKILIEFLGNNTYAVTHIVGNKQVKQYRMDDIAAVHKPIDEIYVSIKERDDKKAGK